ncbi:MAG: biopolymer transporter ExbD [SAR324 cluster bacterium]|nr:biopolymer transporter ExbD [SAR324 cluster bacterium]
MLRQTVEAYEPISDINVTPFVDVLLVLLVVFMITAPLFTKAIDVQLPQENLRSSAVTDARKLVISINKNGRYYIEGRRYPAKRLLQKMIEWKERNPQNTAFLRADKRATVGDMTKLMVMLKNNGISRLGLLVEDKKP